MIGRKIFNCIKFNKRTYGMRCGGAPVWMSTPIFKKHQSPSLFREWLLANGSAAVGVTPWQYHRPVRKMCGMELRRNLVDKSDFRCFFKWKLHHYALFLLYLELKYIHFFKHFSITYLCELIWKTVRTILSLLTYILIHH